MSIKKPALTIALLGALSIISALAFSQTNDQHRPRFKNYFRAMHQLNLSPEQMELMQNLHVGRQENGQEQQALRQSLRELSHSNSYSYAQAETTARQLAELHYQNLLARAEAENSLYQTLSEQQKSMMAEMRSGKPRAHRLH